MHKSGLLIGSLLAFAAGCSSSGSSSSVSKGTPLPCAVDTVLAQSCRSCHGATPSGGAPMSLVTYEDLTAPAKSDPTKKVYELVGARIHDDKKPMPQAPNARTTPLQTATLDNWIAAGAPSSHSTDACKSPAYDGGTVSGLSCTPDVSVRPVSPWAMPQDQTDTYVCYGVDVPALSGQQTIAFAPHIDNPKIVHHVLLYQSAQSRPTTPGPCPLGVGQSKLLYGWAPGGGNFELPPEAGYKMAGPDGVAHFVVQVHYNNLAALPSEVDSSGFDLCTTTTPRPNNADVLAFGSMDFTIPAHGALDMTCDYTVPPALAEMHVISAFPHMHNLGTAIRTTATPMGLDSGAPTIQLGGVDNWSFGNQLWYPMKETVHAGDVVHTRCAYNNQTNAPVSFGEFTSDEMCYSFTMYWPAATSIPSWMVPSLKSTCHPTP